jgi:hypothetical protein
MAQVPTGTTFFVATSFSTSVAVSAISNAAEAVVTATAHGYANGDVVELTSAWGRLNLRAFRIKGVTANNFTLENIDTTNATFFPTGSGAGSVRKVSAFTQITQVMSPASSGGDPKQVTYKYLESDVEYNINDGFTATSYTMDLDADSIGTPGYNALRTLTDVQTNTILRMVMRSGSQVFIPSTVALNEAVSLQDGQINRVKVSFNGTNRSTRYAAA